MSKYNIERWDVILSDSSNDKIPMIYFKPDKELLEFIRVNNYAVLCEIIDTNTIYDDKQIPGVVEKSSITPNCRQNFYEETEFYVISLWSKWYGYPDVENMGKVSFSGFNLSKPNEDEENLEQNDLNQELYHNNTTNNDEDNSKKKNDEWTIMSYCYCSIIIISVIIFFLILYKFYL